MVLSSLAYGSSALAGMRGGLIQSTPGSSGSFSASRGWVLMWGLQEFWLWREELDGMLLSQDIWWCRRLGSVESTEKILIFVSPLVG